MPTDAALMETTLIAVADSGIELRHPLFARWFAVSERVLTELEAAGIARPSQDLKVRAAFLFVNDLAAILLARQIGQVCGIGLLTTEGMTRWAAEAVDVYGQGAFRAKEEGEI